MFEAALILVGICLKHGPPTANWLIVGLDWFGCDFGQFPLTANLDVRNSYPEFVPSDCSVNVQFC